MLKMKMLKMKNLKMKMQKRKMLKTMKMKNKMNIRKMKWPKLIRKATHWQVKAVSLTPLPVDCKILVFSNEEHFQLIITFLSSPWNSFWKLL